MKSINQDAEDEEQCLIFKCLQGDLLEYESEILETDLIAKEYRKILDSSKCLRTPHFDKKRIFMQIKRQLSQ